MLYSTIKSKALSGKRKDQEQTVINQIKNEANNPIIR